MTAQILTYESPVAQAQLAEHLNEVTGARLVGISHRVRGILLHLTERWYRVGRAPYEDVVITDPEVDERHCLLTRHVDGSYEIADLGNHGATRINGHPVTDAILHNGDTVQIGDYEFSYLTDEHIAVSHLEPKVRPHLRKSPLPRNEAARTTIPRSIVRLRELEWRDAQMFTYVVLGLGGIALLSLIAFLLLYWS
jgi:hypothetical protein